MEIRRIIYTTNAIESVNRLLHKVIKTKAVFPVKMLFSDACTWR